MKIVVKKLKINKKSFGRTEPNCRKASLLKILNHGQNCIIILFFFEDIETTGEELDIEDYRGRIVGGVPVDTNPHPWGVSFRTVKYGSIF